MDRGMEIIQAKELRGAAVKCLYDLYGADASTLRMLKSQLRYKGYTDEHAIRRAVRYLSGDRRNYILVTTDEEDYWDSAVCLTPDGVNLAEGDIEDVGVILYE